ncbi:TPA: hypothetical protein VGT23_003367 [Vibrio cholerae]|nr:hypothetical protein [Vibrio cholerae]HEQ3579747.1 hypothetical protein [Vibrio cholerae]
MISKNIKRKIIKTISLYPRVSNRLLPKRFKSLTLSKALYKNNQYLDSEMRLPKKIRDDHKSFALNVLFVNRIYKYNSLVEFYIDYKSEIVCHIHNIREDFLLDFLIRGARNREFSYQDIVNLAKKVKKKQQAALSSLGFLFFTDDYNYEDFNVDETTEFQKFIKVKNLLDLKMDVLPNNHKNVFISTILSLNNGNSNTLLNSLKNMKGFYDFLAIFSVLEPSNSWFFNEENIVGLCDEAKSDPQKRSSILRILWGLCYFDYFKLLSTYDEQPEIILKYNEINKDYQKSIDLINLMIKERSPSLRTLHIYGFWALLHLQPHRIFKYFNSIDKLGFKIPAYDVYKYLFKGDVVSAEKSRMRLNNSLMSFINNNVKTVDYKKFDFNKKCLIIAESGVGDEVRWSRLYHKINRDNIYIVCDPRLKEIFEANFSRINFIAHKRKFRGTGTSILDFHMANIPFNLDVLKNNFDYVISTGCLFTLLDNVDTSSMPYLYLPEFKDNIKTKYEKLRVGIMWSSSLKASGRSLRYALTKDDVRYLRERLPFVDFYSLQSPIDDNDIKFCNENRILIKDDLDLYNDFYRSAIFMNSLNYVIGPSSLNTELGAACGSRFLHIANSPEVAMMRNGRVNNFNTHDQLSNNAVTIFPDIGYSGNSQREINISCMKKIIKILSKDMKNNEKII